MNHSGSKHLHVFQAFRFALDLTPDQWKLFRRECGARRVAFNWTVRTLRALLGEDATKEVPDLSPMLNRWRLERPEVCKDKNGNEWWTEVSPDSFIDGVRSGISGVRRWHLSAHGRIAGRKLNFPHERRRSYRTETCTYLNVSIPASEDRRHLVIPVLGRCRTHENIRKLQRQVANGTMNVFAVTLKRRGKYVYAAYRVKGIRPHKPVVKYPNSVVGIDVGVRWLATIAAADGRIIGRVANPKPLEDMLGDLRRAHRHLSRREPGSIRYKEAQEEIRNLNSRISQKRNDLLHKISRYVASRYGTVVIEDISSDELRSSQRRSSTRAFRRSLSDAALSQLGQRLSYKCAWYGSRLIVADRYFPSTKSCSACGVRNEPGPAEFWICRSCNAVHQRDENAAINLAKYGLRQIRSERKE